MTQKICQAVWAYACSRYEGKNVNLSRVSEANGTRVATLWTYHHGKARWTADLWVRTLLLLGHARIENDALIIPVPPGYDPGIQAFERAYRVKREGIPQKKPKKRSSET